MITKEEEHLIRTDAKYFGEYWGVVNEDGKHEL